LHLVQVAKLAGMPTLTADRIVSAAIEVLDEEGLDGLNMRELGRRLDCASTAVYWHIKTKDELVRLAADALWAEVGLPELDAGDWRTAAAAMATDLHAMLGRHPWLVQAFGSHLLYGQGKARYDDHLLAVYEQAGFAAADADRAAAAVFTYVLGNALGPAAQVSLTRRLGRNGRDPGQQLAGAMDQQAEIARRFPHLRERLDQPGEYFDAPDASFEFGLHAVLDGLQLRLDGR
jgi:AcrR family transcriptional regulator